MEAIVKNAPDSPDLRARASPLLKLFGPNPVVNGAEVDLRKIRDLIYSHAWSRERRDDQKLDFVVSQWGVNRNVPERFIPDTPYSTSAFQHPENLRCNLHLVNKEISSDFCRFIYSVNDLEIDIDLKPDHTQQAEVELQKIAALLQSQNFLKYTQSVRVRVHFPSKYPINHLPAFNQRALENIVCALDQFEQLQYIVIRVVPSHEQALDYELRLVAFPFYLMRMTRWSLRVLNFTTYKWDLIGNQQVSALDKAWELYQETGSLSAAKVDCAAIKTRVAKDGALSITNSTAFFNMNGSQKRKQRKRKAADTVFDKDVSSGHDCKILSKPAQTPDRFNSPDIRDVSATSGTGPAGSVKLSQAEDLSSEGENVHTSAELSANKLGCMAAGPPSPPISPSQSRASQQINENSPSTETSAGEVVLTPSESTDENATFEPTLNLNNAKGGKIHSQASRPTSPPPLSNAYHPDPEPRGSAEPSEAHDIPNAEGAELSGTQRSRKTKRKSKKSRKAKVIKSPEPEPEQIPELGRTADSDLTAFGEMEDKKLVSTEESTATVEDVPDVTLVCEETQVLTVRQWYGANNDQARSTNIRDELQRIQWQVQVRSRQTIDMRRRQIQRSRDGQQLAEVQKKETREKRASKKAKVLHLRRENVATNSPLSRLMESRRANNPKDALKRAVKSEPVASILPAESNNANTGFTEQLEHRSWSVAKRDASNLGDRPFRFGFDGAIERNVEEVVDDEIEEPRDESTEDDDLEKMPFPSGNYLHHDHSVEDDHLDNSNSVSECFDQEATACKDRKLMHPPGLPVPQRIDAGQAYHAGHTTSGDKAFNKDGARERRNKWVAAVVANDDEWYAQRKANQARLEEQMEASGTRYSDYDTPIHDNWTKTDEDGNCLETRDENIVYD